MTDLDELSRIIGRLEGRMTGIEKKLDGLCKKVDNIDKTLTSYRIKSAGQAGSISLLVSVVVNAVAPYFR